MHVTNVIIIDEKKLIGVLAWVTILKWIWDILIVKL
jgi:hypothetical protein